MITFASNFKKYIMEVIGKIKHIGEIQQVSASFRKRELVVTTEEQYPQHILIEFNQDKCDILNSYKFQEDVKVSINLRGREWVNPQGETRYFNSIQGWRIERTTSPQSATQQYAANQQQFAPQTTQNDDEPDDLPF